MKQTRISMTESTYTRARVIKAHYDLNWDELFQKLVEEYNHGGNKN